MAAQAEAGLKVEQSESRSLQIFIAISVGAHFLGFILSFFNLLKLPRPPIEEWSIETEMMSDIDPGSVAKTSLPNAKIAPEAAVPDNQLPQLTKTFTLKEKEKEEEGIAPEIKDKKIETGKALTKDTERDGQNTVKPDAAVKLKKSEALERLIREKLKEKQKEPSRELKAQDNNPMAAIRDNLKEVGLAPSSSGLAGLAEQNRYKAYLRGSIMRNYALPKTYEMQSANMNTRLRMSLNVRGEVSEVVVSSSSGDAAFDDYCIVAVQKSSPFNPPPKELAGEVIEIECKP